MTNETEQLRRLVDARERATKGPWEKRRVSSHNFFIYPKNSNESMVGVGCIKNARDRKEGPANAAFIEAAGSIDLHAILTRMEKMEAALRFYADHKRNTKDGIYGRDNMVRGYFEHDQGQRAKEAFE